MIAFIDESGDSGFALGKGSSLIFGIACVIFNDELEAEKTAVAIKELRRKLKFSERVEFKFNGTTFKPRGHYTNNLELKKYFMAFTWLSKLTVCLNPNDPAIIFAGNDSMAML